MGPYTNQWRSEVVSVTVTAVANKQMVPIWTELLSGKSVVGLTLWFNFGLSLVFIPVVVGTDETGTSIVTAVNITYKLVVTHTKLELLGLPNIQSSRLVYKGPN